MLFGALLVALIWPGRRGYVDRRRGILWLALYAAFVLVMVQSRP